MDASAPPPLAAPMGATLEAVLCLQQVAEHLALQLARVGDTSDVGRASCACKALQAACAAEAVWQVVCKKTFLTSVAARACLQAPQFSWRSHFQERMHRPSAAADSRLCTASLADMALMLVDVWHGATLVYSAALSPSADEFLEDEMYSDSDDFDYDGDCKTEFAIENQVYQFGSGRHCGPAFVGSGGLRACAWLLRRNGRLVRVLCRATPQLDYPSEGSVTWTGTRRFKFTDGPKANQTLCLHLAGWVTQEKTGYRWWPQHAERPPRRDPKLLSRMCVRWEKAAA
jgi:hypothetical protein